MNKLDIFVISLKDSALRLENIRKQLNEMGLTLTVFDAVDGRTGDHDLFKRYNHSLPMKLKATKAT